VSGHDATRHDQLAERFRRAFVWLGGTAIAGTSVELAMLRHWTSTTQLLAWAAVAAAAVALALTVVRPTPTRLRAGRAIAAAVAVTSAIGVVEHVYGNYGAGPLDFRYADRWATMSLASRWWAAASGAVGPSPALAPAILAQAAVFVWLAGIGRTTTVHRTVKVADMPFS
jgi:hypothetical protein